MLGQFLSVFSNKNTHIPWQVITGNPKAVITWEQSKNNIIFSSYGRDERIEVLKCEMFLARVSFIGSGPIVGTDLSTSLPWTKTKN